MSITHLVLLYLERGSEHNGIMKNRLKKVIMILIVIFGLIVIPYLVIISNHKDVGVNSSNLIVAKVNDYCIYQYDIDSIFSQFEGSISKDKILTDLVDEYVVISQADNYQVNVTDDELDDFILQFQQAQKAAYQIGIEVYGEKEYKKSLKEQMIFEKVKDKVQNNELVISDNDVTDFKQFMVDLGDQVIANMDVPEIRDNYQSELQDFLFEQWIIQRKKDVDIVINDIK